MQATPLFGEGYIYFISRGDDVMACEWGFENECAHANSYKCDICFSPRQYFEEKKVKARKPALARRQNKADGRTGSNFEFQNHKTNASVLKDDVVSGMTLNSGATVLEKGDEQIRGIINIMEELKTKVTEKARGAKTFTIQKKWLDKLHVEALKEKMEFWYLKFSFLEGDRDVYVITEQDIIMSMVKTMVTDRREKKLLQKVADREKAERVHLEAEVAQLRAEVASYKANEDLMKFMQDFEKEGAEACKKLISAA